MLKFSKFYKTHLLLRGQSLIEILIAISLASVLLPALLTGLVASREGKAQEGQRLEATALLKGTEEATRSVYESGWNTFAVNGVYHPVISGSRWTLAAGADITDGYTRQITISDAYRDSNFNIVTSGGTPDPSTKKVDSSISWNTPRASSVTTTKYFERYLGNTSKVQTIQADFNTGAFNNTVAVNNSGGEVILSQSPANSDYGNEFLVTATSSIGNMTSSTIKTSLRFTAQATKTVSALRVYLNSEVGTSPSYRYGIQSNASGNPSGTYLGSGVLTATSTGWKTITLSPSVNVTAGTIYHIVVQYNSGTINSSRNIALRQLAPLNALYPQTNVADSSANTLFNSGASWAIVGWQPIYELDYSDGSFGGNPYETNTAVSVFGVNRIGEKFTVSGGNKTASSISFYVNQNSATEPLDTLQVELRDSANNLIEQGVLATAGQTNTTFNYFTYNFSTARILANGSTYRIFLKSPNSDSTNFYQVLRITTTNAANYNSITYDGANSIYTVSANSGSSWTDTNVNWDIGGYYFTVSGAVVYASSGDFTSAVLDAGPSVAFNNIAWTATVPAATALRFQVAVSNNIGGPFDYFGADGNLGSFFTASGPIPLNRINGRYVRYKASFASDGLATPTLSDVSINYSP
jgi:type II secretory pathway pseudopilin PulG